MNTDIIEIMKLLLSHVILTILILSLVFLLVYLAWCKTSRNGKLSDQLPGLRLNIFDVLKEMISLNKSNETTAYAIEKHKLIENLIGVRLGHKTFVFVYNAPDVEVILSSSDHLEKSSEYNTFHPWLGDGLLTSKGQKWSSHRRIIAPTFHMNVLKSYVPTFYKHGMKIVGKMSKIRGKEFDVHEYMSEVTVNILLETIMGYKEPDSKESYEYAMAVLRMCNILHVRQYKLWYRWSSIFNLSSMSKEQETLLKIIHNLSNKVFTYKTEEFFRKNNEQVLDSKENYENEETDNAQAEIYYAKDDLDSDEVDIGLKKRQPFLDTMIDQRYKENTFLTDEDVKEEIDTLMFEGHDTTSAGSSFVLCLLGVHTHVQTKVIEEQFQIFQGSDRPCTYADTLKMKYLEMVILETLRLYPPVPIIGRKVNQDVKLVSGDYTIPAGSSVFISPYGVHRNEKYYPNPTVFDPDNFLPERCQQRNYYSYIPFSAGPRSCVGRKFAVLKLKVLLSTILRNYRIKSTVPEEDFQLSGDIILKRFDGFRIMIENVNN